MTKYIILAGGSGSRLWPYSRSHYPKQILKLFGNKSLLQETCTRIDGLSKENLFVVTNKQQMHLIKQDLKEVNFDHKNLIIEEPYAKNTSAAICLAALKMKKDDILVVLPSDHIIREKNKFNEVVARAIRLAEKGHIVTLGIEATYPETGYGYIEIGDKLTESAFHVNSFKEKPDLETAKKYLKSKRYFWNSGMFVWKVETILNEFQNYQAELLREIKRYLDTKNTQYFYDLENISIDYGILEKSEKVIVEKASFQWSDLGSWKSVFDIQEKDQNGNVIHGDCELVDVRDCFVQNTAKGRTIAAIGIKDISVIDSDDATIICKNDRTQDVKKIVDSLKDKNSEKVTFHKTVFRPWGFFKILEDTDYFKSKRLVVYPKQSISLQYHKKRNETWTLVKGEAQVINGEEERTLRVGETVYIPAGNKHRIRNETMENVELIEVQTGSYFGEDDIIRLEDQYHRGNEK